MKMNYQSFRLSLLCITFCIFISGAQNEQTLWTVKKSTASFESDISFYKAKPKHSTLWVMSNIALQQGLANMPQRQFSDKSQGVVMQFPNQEGQLESYLVKEAPTMAYDLQVQFPEIRSFVGKGLDNPSAILRFSTSPQKGLSGMILSNKKTVFIEPYTSDLKTYISFINSEGDESSGNFICETDYDPADFNISHDQVTSLRNANDETLRTYRLALACTGEYAQFHGGTTAGALAAMNVTMTRVNGIFERDLGLTMEIVGNNQNVIFLDAATDPYTNNNGGVMLGQNQATCNANIGLANYDIGHVFSTGGGGIAQLRSPCTANKARGVTGSPVPQGDAFDVDYVAHEMGHQYGGNHTQNNNCQRSSTTSVEPGSASTIMGYAGICAPNVQNNSDDYFHGENIREMWANISSGNSSSCFTGTATNNAAPVADAGADYTIPVSTAFVLRGSAVDADTSAGLTYCWEQTDTAPATMPPVASSSGGPLFRSLDPTASSDRYMPAFNTVLSGNLATTWEVVPSVGRIMNFSLTVRDNEPDGAATGSDDMSVTVQNFSTPFTVDTPIDWPANSNQTITWVVGQSNAGAINCQTVNVLFTSNGGLSYTTLASGVPNTGSAAITVPNIASTDNAIVLVEAADNIFYAVSNTFPISEALSVNENNFEMISIYPNPNTGTFNINFNSISGNDIAIAVYDIRGRSIYKKSFSSVGKFDEQITLRDPQSGVYLLRIINGTQTITKKIVVD